MGFDANLVSVVQLTFSEIVSRLPELSCLCSMRMQPIEAVGLLQMDLSVAFPIRGLVLGGPGTGALDPRDLTEIEELILARVMSILRHPVPIDGRRPGPSSGTIQAVVVSYTLAISP